MLTNCSPGFFWSGANCISCPAGTFWRGDVVVHRHQASNFHQHCFSNSIWIIKLNPAYHCPLGGTSQPLMCEFDSVATGATSCLSFDTGTYFLHLQCFVYRSAYHYNDINEATKRCRKDSFLSGTECEQISPGIIRYFYLGFSTSCLPLAPCLFCWSVPACLFLLVCSCFCVHAYVFMLESSFLALRACSCAIYMISIASMCRLWKELL